MKRIGRIMWGAVVEVVKGFGKWLLYRSRLESKVDMMMRRLIRLEIVSAMEREDKSVVYQLYDEYKKLGGDSWMDDVFLKWKNKAKNNGVSKR